MSMRYTVITMVSVQHATTRRVKLIGVMSNGSRRGTHTSYNSILKHSSNICVHACKNRKTALKQHGKNLGLCCYHIRRWRLIIEKP